MCSLPFVVIPTPLYIHMTCLVPVGTWVVGPWADNCKGSCGHIRAQVLHMAHFPWQQQFHALKAEKEAAAFQNLPCFHELLQNESKKEKERERESTCRHPHRPQIPSVTSSLTSPPAELAAHHRSPLLVTSKHHLPPQLSSHLVFCCFFIIPALPGILWLIFVGRTN